MNVTQKIRFGLCCLFLEEDIKFKTTTFKYFSKLDNHEKLNKLDMIILHNLNSLYRAIEYCSKNAIFSFRITSRLFPLYTHPECKYSIDDLPSTKQIYLLLEKCKDYSVKNNIRLGFHPDQFVVLNSPREDVVEQSIADLVYHAYLAELLGADVINIHGGGVYGDKSLALSRLKNTIRILPSEITFHLTLENDDKSYTPSDLLPICEEFGIPLVYDVHHHRCLKDDLSEEEASKRAYATWNREPLFHISSPKEGWKGPKPSRHHDYIDIMDFPVFWKEMLPLTVEIEAKAKECAVKNLYNEVYS
ncbi:UV DNA damage endonuclease [Chlamydiales bacterium SCGC AB-751-O23]|jgi:UV DNA damage endonuclease|nr:UV DNA damage endonuclease [Chlamydiales bacterium SCGC AB-751-O23]